MQGRTEKKGGGMGDGMEGIGGRVRWMAKEGEREEEG